MCAGHGQENGKMINEYSIFAIRYSVSPKNAYTLPAIFDHVAKTFGMTVRGLLADATYHNDELGRYLANLAEAVANEAA